MNIRNELLEHQNLEFTMKREEKAEEYKIQDFNEVQNYTENAIKKKIKDYEESFSKFEELETRSTEEPMFKIELEKNVRNKKKIEILEEELLRLQTDVDELENINQFLIDKKEKVIQERKRFVQLNEDIKREIESKVTEINLESIK